MWSGDTLELLASCTVCVDASDLVQLAAWVTLFIGFYVMVRKSNLVPMSNTGFDPYWMKLCQNTLWLLG